MAAGDRLLDALGNIILTADGNVMLDDGAGNPCCCSPPPAMWVQARKCSDGTLADLWFVDNGNGTITLDGGITVVAKPYYFSKSGVEYFVSADDASSGSHGTLATGITTIASCTCAYCTTAPTSVSLQFSGWTDAGAAGGFCGSSRALWYKSGTANGTFGCGPYRCGPGCVYSKAAYDLGGGSIPLLYTVGTLGSHESGEPSVLYHQFEVTAIRTSGTQWRVSADVYAIFTSTTSPPCIAGSWCVFNVFFGTGTAANCTSSLTITSGNAQGGSVILVPNF